MGVVKFSAFACAALALAATSAEALELSWDSSFNPGHNAVTDGGATVEALPEYDGVNPPDYGSARSVQTFGAGDKFYLEIDYQTSDDVGGVIGLATADSDWSLYPGYSKTGYGYLTGLARSYSNIDGNLRYDFGVSGCCIAYDGDTVMMALDLTGSEGKVWFGHEGTWMGRDKVTGAQIYSTDLSELDPVWDDIPLDVGDYYLGWSAYSYSPTNTDGPNPTATIVEVNSFDIPEGFELVTFENPDSNDDNNGSGDTGGTSIPAPAGALLLIPAFAALFKFRR